MLRLPRRVHGDGDHGFVATLVDIARQRGVAGYVDDGTNRWPAVHRSDAARLTRLAVEAAPAGSVLHAVDDEGVAFREIAEAMGRHLGIPTASVAPADASEHFGHLGHFVALDSPASSAITRSCSGGAEPDPVCSKISSRPTTTAESSRRRHVRLRQVRGPRPGSPVPCESSTTSGPKRAPTRGTSTGSSTCSADLPVREGVPLETIKETDTA